MVRFGGVRWDVVGCSGVWCGGGMVRCGGGMVGYDGVWWGVVCGVVGYVGVCRWLLTGCLR